MSNNSEVFETLYSRDDSKIIEYLNYLNSLSIDLTTFNDQSHNNNTILITVVYLNLTKVTMFLLNLLQKTQDQDSYKIYLDKKNKKGYNAFLYSAFRGNSEILKLLVQNGAEVNVKNSSGLNALHLAAQGNFPHIIVNLIEKFDMNSDEQDFSGNTALHWAVCMKNYASIEYLIYYGIDINIKNKENLNALELAKRENANNYILEKIEDNIKVFNFNNNFEYLQDNTQNVLNVQNNLQINNNNINDINNNSNVSGLSGLLETNDMSQLKQFIKSFKFKLKKLLYNSQKYIYIYFSIFIFLLEIISQYVMLKIINLIAINIIYIILYFVYFFFYLSIKKSNPGELHQKLFNSLLLLSEHENNLKNVCPYCINYKNNYTHHCYLCNKCINYEEFHNIFIGNCIGKENIIIYVNYLLYFLLLFSGKLIMFIYLIIIHRTNCFVFLILLILFTLTILIFTGLKLKETKKYLTRFNYFDYYERNLPENLRIIKGNFQESLSSTNEDTQTNVSLSLSENSNLKL